MCSVHHISALQVMRFARDHSGLRHEGLEKRVLDRDRQEPYGATSVFYALHDAYS